MAQATDSRVPFNRVVQRDIPELTEEHELAVTVGNETFSGPVVRIDIYGDSTDVERVVQFNMSYKHYIDGPGWEPWKAYLVEEPAGSYRVNVVLFNGDKSRTRNLDAPDKIDITHSE